MADLFEVEPTPVEQSNGPHAGDILASGRVLQQTRTGYATAVAVQKPRDIHAVERQLVTEANLAGETFYYGWGAGQNRIEGASVKLACAAARCWGNCAIEFLPVQDLPDSWIFTALFVDLETGFTMPRQFRQAKGWKVHGRFEEERKADMRFQIGQSKAVRNVVLNALPSWLIDHAMSAAKSGVKAKIEKYVAANGQAKAVELILKELAKHGVTEDLVLAKCRKTNRESLDIEDLVILRGDLTALESGEAYASELFPAAKQTDKPTKENGGSKADDLADKLAGRKSPPQQQPKPEPAAAPARERQPGDDDF